jgi:hypothetical protein
VGETVHKEGYHRMAVCGNWFLLDCSVQCNSGIEWPELASKRPQNRFLPALRTPTALLGPVQLWNGVFLSSVTLERRDLRAPARRAVRPVLDSDAAWIVTSELDGSA